MLKLLPLLLTLAVATPAAAAPISIDYLADDDSTVTLTFNLWSVINLGLARNYSALVNFSPTPSGPVVEGVASVVQVLNSLDGGFMNTTIQGFNDGWHNPPVLTISNLMTGVLTREILTLPIGDDALERVLRMNAALTVTAAGGATYQLRTQPKAATSVPEPTTLLLLAIGTGLIVLRSTVARKSNHPINWVLTGS